jgi:hypothetical protein
LSFAPERGAADAERFGGARVVASEALQRLQDVHALGVRERRLPRQCGEGPSCRPADTCGGRSSGSTIVAAREDGRALDRVLELAHVAGHA